MKLNPSFEGDQSNGIPSTNSSHTNDDLEPEIPSLTHSPKQHSASFATKLTGKPSLPPLSLSIICENLQTALTTGSLPPSATKDQELKEGLSNLNGQYTRLLTTKLVI